MRAFAEMYRCVVVTELGEHPGAEDRTQSGLGQDDLSVRVPAKMGLHLPLQDLTCSLRVPSTATRARTDAA